MTARRGCQWPDGDTGCWRSAAFACSAVWAHHGSHHMQLCKAHAQQWLGQLRAADTFSAERLPDGA